MFPPVPVPAAVDFPAFSVMAVVEVLSVAMFLAKVMSPAPVSMSTAPVAVTPSNAPT